MATEQQQVVKKVEPAVAETVLVRVNQLSETGGIDLPKDYSAANALKSAMLILQEQTDSKTNVSVLQEVSRESVINSLFKMATLGLNPAKKQCSFIKYGKTLVMQREYAGSIALAKRYGKLAEINGVVIYEGDIVKYAIDNKSGRKAIVSHEQNFENINNDKIKGAYAIMTFTDGTTDVEIMTIDQIRKAWKQGSANGESPAHKNFPDQMAIKSVINRACKLLIASSDDSVLMEPGEDGRIPRQAMAGTLSSPAEEPIQEPQVIDIPSEPEPQPEVVQPQPEQPKTAKAPF